MKEKNKFCNSDFVYRATITPLQALEIFCLGQKHAIEYMSAKNKYKYGKQSYWSLSIYNTKKLETFTKQLLKFKKFFIDFKNQHEYNKKWELCIIYNKKYNQYQICSWYSDWPMYGDLYRPATYQTIRKLFKENTETKNSNKSV